MRKAQNIISAFVIVAALIIGVDAFAIPHNDSFEYDDYSRFPASEVTPLPVDGSDFPYRAIGELFISISTSSGIIEKRCVAHLTGEREITTSRHCPFAKTGDQIVGARFELSRSLAQKSPELNLVVGVDHSNFSGEFYFRKGEKIGGDWARLQLDEPVGATVGFFGKYEGHDRITKSSFGTMGENEPDYIEKCESQTFPENSPDGAFRNGINSMLVDNGLDGNNGIINTAPRYLRTTPICMAYQEERVSSVVNCSAAGVRYGFLVTTCLGRPGLSGSPLYYRDAEFGYVSFGIHSKTILEDEDVADDSIALSSFHFTGIPSAVSDRAPNIIYGPYTRATVAQEQDDYTAGTSSARNSTGSSGSSN